MNTRLGRAIRASAGAGVAVLIVAACGGQPGGPSSGDDTQDTPEQAEGPATLVVWTDANRQAGFEAYQEAHPDVTLDIQTLPEDPAERLLLANQAGEGWPDVIWSQANLAPVLAQDPYDVALDLSEHVPSDLIDDFAPGTMTPCTDGDRITCLRNDFAPSVLWYNQPLMEEFGYAIPTTWEEFEALGVQVAQEHPGYVVGSAGDNWGDLAFFWPSRCPVYQVVEEKTLYTNLDDGTCTRVADTMDALVDAGSMARAGSLSEEFVQEYGSTNKVLMMYAPIWVGLSAFGQMYGTEPGTFAVAPPMQWEEDESVWNSTVGGGAYVVSRHSEYQEAAVDLVTWMATGPYQEDPATVTFPAYAPAQEGWIDQNLGELFTAEGGDLHGVIQEAVDTVWPDFSQPYIPGITYGETMPALIGQGQSVSESLPAWQDAITEQAQAAGWTVVHEQP